MIINIAVITNLLNSNTFSCYSIARKSLIVFFFLSLANISLVVANTSSTEYDILSNVKNNNKIEQAIKESQSSAELKKYKNKLAAITAKPSNQPNGKSTNKLNNPGYTQTVTLVDINKQVELVLDKINQVNTKLLTKINSGMSDVNNFKQTLPEIDTKIEQVAIYVKGLGKALSMLSTHMKKQQQVLDEYITNNIGKPVTSESKEPGLSINSMIATRAWMQTVTGQKFSVGLGDVIPGYGKVVAINIQENFILTDLEIKIKR